jgi:hypothetical protein
MMRNISPSETRFLKETGFLDIHSDPLSGLTE